MAITFCRSIGRLMRFDRQRFTLLATSVVRRTAFHRSHGVSLELDKQIACFSTSLLRNFYSTQPSLQKETYVVTFCVRFYNVCFVERCKKCLRTKSLR